MLDLPYSTKRKRVSNPIVGATGLLVNLESAETIMQRPGNSAEQSCKWLITSTRVLCIRPRAHEYPY